MPEVFQLLAIHILAFCTATPLVWLTPILLFLFSIAALLIYNCQSIFLDILLSLQIPCDNIHEKIEWIDLIEDKDRFSIICPHVDEHQSMSCISEWAQLYRTVSVDIYWVEEDLTIIVEDSNEEPSTVCLVVAL